MRCIAVLVVVLGASMLAPASANSDYPSPQSADDSWKQGFAAYGAGDMREAERLFRRAIEQGGEAYEQWGWLQMVLGTVLYRLDQPAEALAHLHLAKELVTERQERFQVNHALGQVFVGRGGPGDYDKAIEVEEEARKYADNSAQQAMIDQTLGQAYYYMDAWSDAIEYFERAFRLRQRTNSLTSMLARSYLEVGRLDESLALCQELLDDNPRHPQALVISSDIYRHREDYDTALEFAQRGIEVAPTLPEAVTLLERLEAAQAVAEGPPPVFATEGVGFRFTRPFSVARQWELHWDADGPITVSLHTEGGEPKGVIAKQNNGGEGTTFQPQGGSYYLEIDTEGNWEISIHSLSETQAAAAPPAAIAAEPTPTAGGAELAIVDVDARITESTDVWSRFAWKLTLRNGLSNAVEVNATIEFLDADGFVIDDTTEYGLVVPSGETREFTGYDLLDASIAPNVKGVKAKLSRS